MFSQPLILPPVLEQHENGFGIGHRRPRVSWRFSTPEAGIIQDSWTQCAYDVEVAESGKSGPESHIYHVDSSESVLVPWPAEALRARQRVSIRVRAYQAVQKQENGYQNAPVTDWSPWVAVEVSLLEREDWIASFITSAVDTRNENGHLVPLRFRKCFRLPQSQQEVIKARLYITSFGVYEAHLNGRRIGDHVMSPGWTSYDHRLNFQTFDITSMLSHDNAITVEVADGWYAGRLSWEPKNRCIYGNDLGVLAQLEVTFKSGPRLRVSSDSSWICNPSAFLSSQIYDGELYDARADQAGWKDVEFPNEESWKSVKEMPFTKAKLVTPDAPPVRVTQEVPAIEVIISPSGKTILDFGQNLVGVLRIRKLHAATTPGQTISFIHAEVLEKGELAIRPLRGAICTDTVILSQTEDLQDWSPKFTFHGFRYVQVDGWPIGRGPINKEDFTALVWHTDMRRRGWFSCSDALVNKLHENVVWGMRGNFLSIPTDCPQRDERLGWTADIQVFCPTASFLYDTVGTLSSWLEDLSAEQLAKSDGIPGLVVPDILPLSWRTKPQAVWHDAAILTPLDLYKSSGDMQILSRQFASMKAWIKTGVARGSDGLWDPSVWQLGDWLDPAAPAETPGDGRTPPHFVADAYLVHVTTAMSDVCRALSFPDEAAKYSDSAATLKAIFQRKYITPAGNLVSPTQTALSLALSFSLEDSATTRKVFASTLSALVRSANFRIATGFAGTPLICHALTSTNQTQLAYRMLLEQHCPSWLYPVTMGATTVWERWDSLLPNGDVHPGSMTSFNHYALGAVADWLHTTVAGITTNDAWRTIIVKPVPGGGMTHAEASFEGPYGLVKSSWTVGKGEFRLELRVPPNSTAVISLPGSGDEDCIIRGSGRHLLCCNWMEEGKWPPSGGPVPIWGREECGCCEN